MTTENRAITLENIGKIADHLEHNVTDDEFDFEYYRAIYNKPRDWTIPVPFISMNDCGAIGCVLGNAPFAPGLQPIESDYSNGIFGVMAIGFSYGDKYVSRILPDLEYPEYKLLFLSSSNNDSRLGRVKVLRDWLASGSKEVLL